MKKEKSSIIIHKKICCDSEIYCGHPFGSDICEHCNTVIDRFPKLKLKCPNCGASLRNLQ